MTQSAALASAPNDFGLQGEIAFQAELYNHPNPTRRGLHRLRRDWVESHAARFTGPGKSAIEIGVGCGIYVQFMADRGASVTAIDINQGFLDNVSAMPGVTVLNADATLALPVQPVDFALCTEVLEHVPPDRSLAMLKSLHGALKPDGRLLLSTPQRYATVEMMVRLFKIPGVLAIARRLYGTAEDLGHINCLTHGQLGRQLAEAGFVIEAERRFGFYLPVIAEFGGSFGWKLLRGIESAIRPVPVLRGLLWTQAYLLRRA